MMKKVLVVVDMQNDFVDGALGSEYAAGIVPEAVKKIREYAEDPGTLIYATMDTHGNDYLQTAEGRKLAVPHCVKGTEGRELNQEIAKALPERTVIVEKPAFGSTALAAFLQGEALEKGGADLDIAMLGLCTDICVVSNALILKAALPEARISVFQYCCAGTTPEKHLAALEVMRSCQINIE